MRLSAARYFGVGTLLGLTALVVLSAQPRVPAKTPPGKAERVLFEDAHLRLLEIAYLPGAKVMETVPVATVTMYDAAMPMMDGFKTEGEGGAPPPTGREYPYCTVSGPQPAHSVANEDTFPLHVYRVEFKRVDGSDFAANWKTWYPWMLDPIKPVKDLTPGPELGPPVRPDFPYAAALDSYIAAPNNHYMRYQDAKVRFLEVVIRPGERENLHDHPYPSAFPADTWGTAPPTAYHPPPDNGPGTPGMGHTENGGDHNWDPSSKMNAQDAGRGPAPQGLRGPSCSTMGPEAPHAGTNVRDTPIHFYRMEYVRVDGDGIKTNWAKWYPWVAKDKAASH
jgi:hypothetical protein